MNNEDSLDLLDLDDGASLDALPAATPFAAPRPKKPWLLLGVGLVVIILATYIIIRTIGGDSSSSMEVDLDTPTIVVDGDAAVAPSDVLQVPAQPAANPQPAVRPQPMPQPAQPATQPAAPKPVANPQPADTTPGVPVRVIEDRKEVVFNPQKVAPQPKPAAKKPAPAAKPAARPAAKPAAKKTAPSAKPQAPVNGGWYVQFGSYSTRALAENAQRQIRAAHSNLFAGKQFVILAAQLPNGSTTYRLRIAFANANDANGFCRNTKSDGVDCYVAK